MELHRFNKIKDAKVGAIGTIFGKVTDMYFEDDTWVIRYFVVDTGEWFQNKKVLISPAFIEPFEWESEVVPIRLQPEQIKSAPPFDSDKPLSRQYEENFYDHYGLMPYWTGGNIWRTSYYASDLPKLSAEQPPKNTKKSGDPHLRSANEVKGYLINGIKEENSTFGHIHDFIFDMDTWTIRYFVLDTVNFMPSKKVLLSPTWISAMPWQTHEVHVRLSKEKIKSAPEYDTESPPSRSYEKDLHAHYGQAFYWDALPERKKASRE